MEPEAICKVLKALDNAIATVADVEYSRLSENKSHETCATCVAQALESLAGLASGREPDYNEWDALFYITWYQPRQINLAYSILSELCSNSNQCLHVIDFGCGARPVQFALALLGTTPFVTILSGIDPSKPMREIGDKLWRVFHSNVEKNPELRGLLEACNAILPESHYSPDSNVIIHPELECWLMAMHTVYDSNVVIVRDSIQEIRESHKPKRIILTCPSDKLSVTKSAVTGEFQTQPLRRDDLWSRSLPETTNWRRSLIKRLPQQTSSPIIENFLRGPVLWNERLDNTKVCLWSSDPS